MTIETALHSWKHLAENTVQLNDVKTQLSRLEELVGLARAEFDDALDGLSPADRDAIFSIMSVYQESERDADELQWVLNKVGNEGVDGIAWSALQEAWCERYPDRTRMELGLVLRRNQQHFARMANGNEEVFRLTPDGQAAFLNS